MSYVNRDGDPDRPLTEQESKFLDEYIATAGNQSVAYLRVYSCNGKPDSKINASAEGRAILERPAVARELQCRIQPYRDSLATEEKMIRDKLYECVKSPHSSWADKSRAIDILNRMACRYINRTINQSDDNPLSNVDTATLVKLLEE